MASPSLWRRCGLHVSLPRALEEEPDHEDLQSTHADDQTALYQAEVDNPLLRASDGAEVTVLARPEILLIPGHSRQLSRNLDDRFFKGGGLLGRGALLGGEVHSGFVLDL